VEPDYLPDLEVFLLSAVFIPHEVFTPQKYVHSSTQGCSGGVVRGQGGYFHFGGKPPKLPCKSIL
jgi:hypothetical protein